jgi:hypothetical protein
MHNITFVNKANFVKLYNNFVLKWLIFLLYVVVVPEQILLGSIWSRLLARVLKGGVQFWHTDTSTVKGRGGRRENVPLENLWSLRYFISVSFPSSLEIFQTHRYASLLIYDIFIQPGTPSNWSKCQMYNNNENWSYFVSDILIYLGNNFPFPPEFGRPKASIFCSMGVPGRLDALLAKSLIWRTL